MLDDTRRPAVPREGGNPSSESASSLDRDRVAAHQARVDTAAVAFCQRNNCTPTKGTVNLWGYGQADILFEGTGNRDWWCALTSLIEPTGVDYHALKREWENDLIDDLGGVDSMNWVDDQGLHHHLDLCTGSFAMRIFAGISPWAHEFNKNLMDVYRRAAVLSGLADKLDITEVIAPDGEIPTAEQAKAAAFRGPAIP